MDLISTKKIIVDAASGTALLPVAAVLGVAPLVKVGVPDLTRIAWRDGGEFPTEDVRRTIDGRFERPAHGPRDMPVWGWRFYDSRNTNDAEERARVDAVIDRLVEYLRSIQKNSG
mgnify:CR=1 FL=1